MTRSISCRVRTSGQAGTNIIGSAPLLSSGSNLAKLGLSLETLLLDAGSLLCAQDGACRWRQLMVSNKKMNNKKLAPAFL
jgi:hypothetical protein